MALRAGVLCRPVDLEEERAHEKADQDTPPRKTRKAPLPSVARLGTRARAGSVMVGVQCLSLEVEQQAQVQVQEQHNRAATEVTMSMQVS